MILHDQNKNKFVGLVVLVVLSVSFVVWQWLAFSPWQKIEATSENDVWNTVSKNTSEALKHVKTSFSLAAYHIDNLKAELNKEHKQSQLLEATKQYVSENKAIQE
ncbi:hypothetical protein HN670_01770 [bacterium]|jgi:hypothetical protein|nr:hypothetical protein [bacterium]